MLKSANLKPFYMKKKIFIIIILVISTLQINAQKPKDVLLLKNGSMIFGKLVEVNSDHYKMQTSDGSILIFPLQEVEKFTKEIPDFDGRKTTGFTFSLESGILIGSQNAKYSAPFSFNLLAGITSNTKNITSLGSGVEFIGRPFTPIFVEYKHIINNYKSSPFVFGRGGVVLPLGGDGEINTDFFPYTGEERYKGGASFTFGTGISWAKTDYETYLSFGYRYIHTSYTRKEYNIGDVTYNNTLNRLEVKFGFKF